MKKTIYLFFIFLVLQGCNKTNIRLAEPAPVLSINGILTNETSSQTVHVEQSHGLTESSAVYITNGTVSVSSNNTNYPYTYASNGDYLSNTNFALIPNSVYTFKMSVADSVYSCDFVMPTPITANNITAEKSGFYKELTVYLSTTTSTKFKLNLFSAEIDTLTQDTVWLLKSLENKIYEANNSSIKITDEVLEEKDSIIKLEVLSLTDKSTEYLKLLYEYRKNQSTTNQYINPPKASFNNAYGLIYGSYKTSVIKKI